MSLAFYNSSRFFKYFLLSRVIWPSLNQNPARQYYHFLIIYNSSLAIFILSFIDLNRPFLVNIYWGGNMDYQNGFISGDQSTSISSFVFRRNMLMTQPSMNDHWSSDQCSTSPAIESQVLTTIFFTFQFQCNKLLFREPIYISNLL